MDILHGILAGLGEILVVGKHGWKGKFFFIGPDLKKEKGEKKILSSDLKKKAQNLKKRPSSQGQNTTFLLLGADFSDSHLLPRPGFRRPR